MTTPRVALDPQHALPNAVYRDPAVLEAEMAGIWHGDWLFVTTEDAVSAPGVPRRSSNGRLAKWISRTMRNSHSLPDFLPEDKAICERGQRGASGDFSPGRLVHAERVVADFGHYLDWRLNNIEPPAVHVESPAVNNMEAV